jgi:uncharacterized protein YdhG (YjbR/CyaY superfamily)
VFSFDRLTDFPDSFCYFFETVGEYSILTKLLYTFEMSVIDDYLRKIEPEKRKKLERIRTIARAIVPEAQEVISYGMPTLKYHGKSFLGFDAHAEHLGIYPYGGEEIEVFKEQLGAFALSKGAIRVPYDKPISESLLKKIIIHRIKRITT